MQPTISIVAHKEQVFPLFNVSSYRATVRAVLLGLPYPAAEGSPPFGDFMTTRDAQRHDHDIT